jgi:pimeloyl-ACP methyl ester carboxylesterase
VNAWLRALLLLAALSAAPGALAADKVPRFEPTECWFAAIPGERNECGYLVVPENRETHGGRAIRLAIAILRATNASPLADPLVAVGGGPGGSIGLSDEGIRKWRSVRSHTPAWQRRDVILFEERGTGHSMPSLDCDEIDDHGIEFLKMSATPRPAVAIFLQAEEACRDRLLGDGIDLTAYTSAAMAADLADLRRTLGYSHWSLFGGSYGTRLALTVMRDHPDGLRAVILDSVLPVQGRAFETDLRDQFAALQRVFDACPYPTRKCGHRLEHIEDDFWNLVQRLNAKPPIISSYDVHTKQRAEFGLTGILFAEAVVDSMSFASGTVTRHLIDRVSAGDNRDIARISDYLHAKYTWLEDISDGLFLSVECYEAYPFADADRMREDNREYWTRLGVAERDQPDPVPPAFCGRWPHRQPPAIENAPVVSDIPTLLLAGEFDPRTPPADARAASRFLPHSFLYVFRDKGHGVTPSSVCANAIVSAFTDSPNERPDPDCVSEAVVPDEPVTSSGDAAGVENRKKK